MRCILYSKSGIILSPSLYGVYRVKNVGYFCHPRCTDKFRLIFLPLSNNGAPNRSRLTDAIVRHDVRIGLKYSYSCLFKSFESYSMFFFLFCFFFIFNGVANFSIKLVHNCRQRLNESSKIQISF